MFSLLLIVAVAAVDRFIKLIALNNPTLSFELISNVFWFEPAVNTIGPLGLPVSGGIFFTLSALVSILLFILALLEKNRWEQILIFGVVFGVLSNAYDRWFYGYIIDPFRFGGGFIFNLADILIVFGVAIVLSRRLWLYVR